MKHVLGLCLAVMLAGCADPPAPQADREAANLAYIACLDRAARELDDGQSDASSVAVGVRSQCTGEYWTAMRLQSQGLSMQARVLFDDRADARQIDYATRAVLRVRAERKGQR